jgi:non-canonical purine NTP pyrophosphatase (RdgB/HAM1 family)
VLAGVCFLAITPFFWMGIPSGHDFEFHLFSWMEVLGQWKQGIVYPRWAALTHWGYGEARFLFYPPASWTLGAALGAFLPWKLVPGVYCWIALTLAGIFMYRLGREWLPAKDALFAAAFYAVNPYHLVIVYWRSAYAELLAAALLPLMVAALMRLKEPGFRPVLWLSLILAASWLTNAPAALMIHYSAAGLAVLLAVRERSRRLLPCAGLAVILGIGLASFYLLPAIFEEKWINIGEVLAAGVRPQDNFLFTTSADVDHNRFNLLVSYVALAEIGIMALAIWRSYASRLKKETLWLLLSAWGGVTILLMFSISNPLWQYLPKFRYVQLPFRWLLCLNAALALLLAMAARRWLTRALAVGALLAVLMMVCLRIQAPWWDSAGDIQEMHGAMSGGTGNEGIDEYVPAGADPYELNKNLPRITDPSGKEVPAQMIQWGPLDKHFIVQTSRPANLTLRLFNYPAWRVMVNDQPVETQTTDVTGQMLIPVAAGRNEVRIHFGRTLDRTIGDIVSTISLILLLAAFIKTRPQNAPERNRTTTRTVRIATSNPGKLRDFAGAAAAYGITVAGIPGFSSLPPVVEDGATFEANARKKAEAYSLAVPGELVLADDSGLEIDALDGAPGVHSARYAADEPHAAEINTDDEANNALVLRELRNIPQEKRTARFVCVLAAARDGRTLQIFRGTAEGIILEAPRGQNGFGYDPLFYFPQIGKTFAELSAEEKAQYSHRGAAFRTFLSWYQRVQPRKT